MSMLHSPLSYPSSSSSSSSTRNKSVPSSSSSLTPATPPHRSPLARSPLTRRHVVSSQLSSPSSSSSSSLSTPPSSITSSTGTTTIITPSSSKSGSSTPNPSLSLTGSSSSSSSSSTSSLSSPSSSSSGPASSIVGHGSTLSPSSPVFNPSNPIPKMSGLPQSNPWAPPLLPIDIKSFNGKWDGESINRRGIQEMMLNLSFSPMEGSLVIEHPQNHAAVCFASIRIRGFGHCIDVADGHAAGKKLSLTVTGLLDPNTGIFELCIASTHGYYNESLTFRGILDYVSRSLAGEAQGTRAANIRLSYSGEQRIMPSPKSMTKQLHPPGTGSDNRGRHHGASSSSKPTQSSLSQGSSPSMISRSLSSSSSSNTPSGPSSSSSSSSSSLLSLMMGTMGTGSGNEMFESLTGPQGEPKIWEGKLMKHGSDIIILLTDLTLNIQINNDIGTIHGKGSASWPTGYRVPLLLEGSFDHRTRITMMWAQIILKLLSEPNQTEQFSVCIDLNQGRIEGHNPHAQVKLYPAPPQSSSLSSSSMYPSLGLPPNVYPLSSSESATGRSVPVASSNDPSLASGAMSQSSQQGQVPQSSSMISGGGGSSSLENNNQYGNHGMMYAPQMTPHGITYVLMPIPLAMQAHAAAASMQAALFGPGNNNMYPLPPLVNPPTPLLPPSALTEGNMTSSSSHSNMSGPSNDGSGGGGSGGGAEMGMPHVHHPLPPPHSHGGMKPSDEMSGLMMGPPPSLLDPAILNEVQRQRKHNQRPPQKQVQSEAEVIASFQHFEVGDRVYMYTIPANIVQSILLRGPVTAGLKDSPYPYCSPRQLHFNPPVLPKSEGGKKRRQYQSSKEGPSSQSHQHQQGATSSSSSPKNKLERRISSSSSGSSIGVSNVCPPLPSPSSPHSLSTPKPQSPHTPSSSISIGTTISKASSSTPSSISIPTSTSSSGSGSSLTPRSSSLSLPPHANPNTNMSSYHMVPAGSKSTPSTSRKFHPTSSTQSQYQYQVGGQQSSQQAPGSPLVPRSYSKSVSSQSSPSLSSTSMPRG